jgi:hypothetical protein
VTIGATECNYSEQLEELASHLSQIQKKLISEKFDQLQLNERNVKFRPSKGEGGREVEFIEDGDRRQDFDQEGKESLRIFLQEKPELHSNSGDQHHPHSNSGNQYRRFSPQPPLLPFLRSVISFSSESREVSLFVDDVVVCGQFKVIFFFPLV